jgi:hypothetical protein
MMRLIFSFVYLYFLSADLACAQTISERSNFVSIDVDPDKSVRTDLVYEEVKLVDASGNLAIEPGEEVCIHFRIRNRSARYSQSLYINASLDEPLVGLLIPELLPLHPIAPGKTVDVVVPLKSTQELAPGLAVVDISIREADIFEADQLQLNVQTNGSVISAGRRKR